MSNLPTHLNLALKVAAGLAHPTIDRYIGSFLLGSTSPDIRIMTKWKRDRTHFAPLTIDRIGTGVEGFFRAYPALADSSMTGTETRVFVSGYFTHLVADEAWILDIYRPISTGRACSATRSRPIYGTGRCNSIWTRPPGKSWATWHRFGNS